MINLSPIQQAHKAALAGLCCIDYQKTRKVAILLLRIALARLENDRPMLAMSEVQAQSLLAFEGLPLNVPAAAKLVWQSAFVLATLLCRGGRDHE